MSKFTKNQYVQTYMRTPNYDKYPATRTEGKLMKN